MWWTEEERAPKDGIASSPSFVNWLEPWMLLFLELQLLANNLHPVLRTNPSIARLLYAEVYMVKEDVTYLVSALL